MRAILAIAIAALILAPASAREQSGGEYAEQLLTRLYPQDQDLAEGWEDHLRGLLELVRETSEDPQSLQSIPEFEALLEAERLPFSSEELEGSWRMRSLQATEAGAFVYQYFPARIYPEAQAYIFDKDSGSQRHRGLLAQLDETTVFFAGALYYGYEEPRIYSALTPGEAAPEQREFDAVAEIYKIGNDHFLMAFAPQDSRARLYEIRK